MIQIEHSGTKERKNVSSLEHYSSEWKQVATIPAGPVDPSLYGAGDAPAGTINLAMLEAQLVAKVKAEAERRKMLVMSTGGAKKTEYAEKAAEVRYFNSLGGTVAAVMSVLNAMPAAQRAMLFPYATADAAAHGDTLPAAVARFNGGMTGSASVPGICATEARGCTAIKAATTATSKLAAFAAITWG